DGPVREFLRRYPNHPQAAQVTAWQEQAENHDMLSRLQHNAKKPKFVKPYPGKMDPNFEAQAFLAMRFEQFGDVWFSRWHWKAAQDIAQNDPEQAPAKQLAARRYSDWTKTWDERADKDARAYVRSLLTAKLEEAKKAKETHRIKDAEDIVTAIVELYGDEKRMQAADVADLVKQAEEMVTKKAAAEKK